MLWWALPSIFGTLIGLMVGRLATQSMRRPAGYFLSATGILIAWWCLTEWVSLLSLAQDYRTVLTKLQFIGIASVPVLWSCTALAYSGNIKLLYRIFKFIWIIPVITLALVFSSEYHQQIWLTPDMISGSGQLDIINGDWFWVHVLYSYSIVVVSTAMLAMRVGFGKGQRFKFIALVAGPVLVVLVNINFVLGLQQQAFDPTPAAFAVASLLLLIALRQNILLALPAASSYEVEKLIDGVLVLDEQGRIADCNPIATAILGPVNTRPGQMFADLLPGDIDLDDSSGRILQIADGRWLNVRISDIETDDGPGMGHVAYVRDVTKEKILEETIIKTQRELGDVNARLQALTKADDGLRLASRDNLDERLRVEWSRSARHGTALSLVLLSFNTNNDGDDKQLQHGADRVLRQLTENLPGIIRPEDLAARHVGGQVAVLLPCTNERQAAEFARRIQRTISEKQYQNDEGQSFSVDVSAGVVARSRAVDSVDELLARAETALYQSKHSGRNAVSVASESGLVRLEPLTLSPRTDARRVRGQ
jgi:diguanylate cyclase (GGDEF)-like protein